MFIERGGGGDVVNYLLSYRGRERPKFANLAHALLFLLEKQTSLVDELFHDLGLRLNAQGFFALFGLELVYLHLLSANLLGLIVNLFLNI